MLTAGVRVCRQTHGVEHGKQQTQPTQLCVRPCVVLWRRFVTVLVSNSSGWIADGLANSGTLTMTQTRKLLQVVGSVGPGEAACCTPSLSSYSPAGCFEP